MKLAPAQLAKHLQGGLAPVYIVSGDDPLLCQEAADEYLLQSFDLSQAEGRPVIVFNDAFGALACALHGQQLYSVSDSYVSQLATRHNLGLNGMDDDTVTLLDSLAP